MPSPSATLSQTSSKTPIGNLKLLLLTRDAVDLLAETSSELLKHSRLFLVRPSMTQPKSLPRHLLSTHDHALSTSPSPSSNQVTLHPSTVSPSTKSQIIVANQIGDVTTTPIETPLTLHFHSGPVSSPAKSPLSTSIVRINPSTPLRPPSSSNSSSSSLSKPLNPPPYRILCLFKISGGIIKDIGRLFKN